jgi:predicted PurR-regulated permease PerM
MNSFCKYLLIILGLAVLGFILWYFSSIVAYILIAAVLSLIGGPVIDLLDKVKIKKFKIPKAMSALITVILLWALVFTFFRIFIPLIANQANELSRIDTGEIYRLLDKPINWLRNVYNSYHLGGDEMTDFDEFINSKIRSVVNISFITNFFSSIFGTLGNIFVAIFAISFILFFFLKDQSLFTNALVLLIPQKHETSFRHALSSTQKLLMRYFIGICVEILVVMIAITIGMTIVGMGFRHAMVIGLVIGILNVIPYLGPWLGGIIGIIIGIADNLDIDLKTGILPMMGYMLLVILIVQILDNNLLQPLIFSSSVKAHPLEVFLVIMIAGTLAGIPGMILAVPAYTVIRVFAKEFFNNFRVVKKITENI